MKTVAMNIEILTLLFLRGSLNILIMALVYTRLKITDTNPVLIFLSSITFGIILTLVGLFAWSNHEMDWGSEEYK